MIVAPGKMNRIPFGAHFLALKIYYFIPERTAPQMVQIFHVIRCDEYFQLLGGAARKDFVERPLKKLIHPVVLDEGRLISFIGPPVVNADDRRCEFAFGESDRVSDRCGLDFEITGTKLMRLFDRYVVVETISRVVRLAENVNRSTTSGGISST
jgi:hypothetical protein